MLESKLQCQDQVKGSNSGVLEVIPEDGSVGSVGRNRNLEGNLEGAEGHGGWKLKLESRSRVV
jgi:hypothetical protein